MVLLLLITYLIGGVVHPLFIPVLILFLALLIIIFTLYYRSSVRSVEPPKKTVYNENFEEEKQLVKLTKSLISFSSKKSAIEKIN